MPRTKSRKRTKTKIKKTQDQIPDIRPDAILAADIHCRETVPVCRTDDFLAAMFGKIKFIGDLQKKWDCAVLVAGDIFDYWKASPWLLAKVLPMINHWIAVPGQHDLPQHSWELYDKSGLAVLEAAGPTVMRVLKAEEEYYCGLTDNPFLVTGYGWGVEPSRSKPNEEIPQVALVHKLIYRVGNPPYPGAHKDGLATVQGIKQFYGYNLIVSGDNHETIMRDAGTRILVNPGSMMRTTADQINHKPSIFLWYAKEERVEQVYLPITEGVITREHIDVKEERDSRIEAFVEGLKEGVEFGVSYRDNLDLYFAQNEIKPEIQEINRRSLENA